MQELAEASQSNDEKDGCGQDIPPILFAVPVFMFIASLVIIKKVNDTRRSVETAQAKLHVI